MFKTIKIVCFIAFLLGGVNAYAQLSKSPYTTQGIGDIQGMGLVSNESMGGIGIALSRPYFISNINPALLPLNTVTSFEIAALGERRDLSQGEIHQSNSDLNFGYLAFSFPIVRGKNSVSFGLKPYSKIEYKFLSKQKVVGSDSEADYSVRGTGGINQAYVATGVRLFKNFFVGGRASYYFGSALDETNIDLFPIEEPDTSFSSFYKSSYFRQNSYSDAGFSLGMVYSAKIRKDVSFSIGGTVDFETSLSGKRIEKLELKNFRDQVLLSDTVTFTDHILVTLPARYGVGISMENGFKWAAGVDFTIQDWSQFKNHLGETENLKSSYRIAAGMEMIPDYTSVTSYIQRAFYRVGGYYGSTPYSKNNQQINEFGINFGVGLPMREGSLINVMFGYGQRGFGGENLIKEDVYKISLGITFNDSGWFYRRKYN